MVMWIIFAYQLKSLQTRKLSKSIEEFATWLAHVQ